MADWTVPDYGISYEPQHAQRLWRSRIDPAVARAREYRTVDTAAGLHRFGFVAATTGWLPGMVLPWRTLAGPVSCWQYRPDHPFGDDGPKYLFPPGVAPGLDCHPWTGPKLTDIGEALWVTEGLFKVDALTSAGVAALGLNGVWGWRTGDAPDPAWATVDLAGRTMPICFDADAATNPQVWDALDGLWKFLRRQKAHPLYVRLPQVDAGGHTGVDDYLALLREHPAADVLADLLAGAADELPERPLDVPALEGTGRPQVDMSGARPVVVIAADLARRVAEADDQTEVYAYGGAMSTLEVVNGRAALRTVDTAKLDWLIGHGCDPVMLGRNGTVRRHVAVPPVISRMVLAMNPAPWPVVEALSATPFVRHDGTVVVEPGYDWLTRTVYRPLPGFVLPALVAEPGPADVAAAVATVDDLLADFGLRELPDRAHAFALLLTPFVRPLVGLTPLFVVDSPTPGSGKGLLVSLTAVVATGAPCGTWPWPNEAEEARKLVTTILAAGTPLALLDEAHVVGGVAMANVLTSDTWNDRLLGTNRAVSLPNRTLWCAAGNNVEVRGDLARRSVVVRLDPRVDNPDLRSAETFRHHPLLSWAMRNRGPLVAAALTLCRGWIQAGSAPGPVTLGSFEEWSAVVGGVLHHAGVEGFLTNRGGRPTRNSDPERDGVALLLDWLHDRYRGDPFLIKDAAAGLTAADLELPPSVGHCDDKEFAHRLAGLFRRIRDRRFGALWVDLAGTDGHTGRARWVVHEQEAAWPW